MTRRQGDLTTFSGNRCGWGNFTNQNTRKVTEVLTFKTLTQGAEDAFALNRGLWPYSANYHGGRRTTFALQSGEKRANSHHVDLPQKLILG